MRDLHAAADLWRWREVGGLRGAVRDMSVLVDDLCAHEDPVVAYRARRLLANEREDTRAMRRLRVAVGASTMARHLLTPHRGKPLHPYAKWQGPHWTLYSLAEIGYPTGDDALLPLRDRVLDWMLAPAFLKPQLRLGILDEVRTPRLVERLVTFQWPDGGWNCDKREGARTSSVQETLIPLRGLAVWSQATGDARAKRAVKRAAEFLLARRLLWRRRDGELIVPDWGGPVDAVHYPIRFYDVLSALLVMAELGLVRDPRCSEQKRLVDGTFPVEWTNARTTHRVESRGTYADWGPRGKRVGNPFVTVDALYVLREAGRERW